MTRIIVVLAAAALALAGCASGPSQVDAAAIVGNTVISVNSVQQELITVLNGQAQARTDQQQGTLDTVSRTIVGARVIDQVVLAAQQQNGISVDPQQVQRLIAANGGADALAKQLVYDPAAVAKLAQDAIAEQTLARAYADRLSVTFDFVVENSRASAVTAASQLASDPGSMTSLIAQATQAGGSGRVGTVYPLAKFLQDVATAQAQQTGIANLSPLYGANPNTVVVFQPSPSQGGSQSGSQGGGWMVALVHQRTVGPAPTPGTASTAANSDPQVLAAVGLELLQPMASQLGVRISPRYGVWDPVGMQVVASSDQALGVEMPVRTVRP